ncbi:MAG TPA: flagellar hook-length control protein FliK [Conexibacter sp.]|nr:flagellar hook-length control protein FliK [Conexibacter sp.]
MTQIPSTLLEPPPRPAKSGARPPGDPPDAPFASVLEDHQARTAVAEGQTRQEPRDGVEPGTTGPTEEAAPQTTPSADPLLPTSTVPLSPSPNEIAATGPLPADAAGVDAVSAGAATPATETATAATAATAPTTSALVPAPTARPAATAPATDQASGIPDGRSAPAASEPHPSARPVTTPSAAGEQLAGEHGAGQPATAANTPASAAAGSASTTDPTATSQTATAQPSAPNGALASPAPAPAQAPIAAEAPAPATPPARGVRLADAVETVRLALRASAERGVAHARISLSPRELGGIEIHLKQTADGLVARVVAEHVAAAQLLHHAGAELRRTLEAQGLTLLQLDVGTDGAEHGAAGGRRDLASGGAGDGSADGRPGASARRDAALGGVEAADLDLADSTTTTLALPNGALVDVLA